eukprot:gene8119-10114_t
MAVRSSTITTLILLSWIFYSNVLCLDLDDLTKAAPFTKEELEHIQSIRMPFIFSFHKGKEDLDHDLVDQLAARVDGLARVGTVDVANSALTSILKDLGISSSSYPKFRAYEFDIPKTKFKDSEDVDTLIEFVKNSVPENLIKTIPSVDQIQPNLISALQQKKLSSFVFTNKDGIPDLLLKLAIWMDQSYQFHIVNHPDEALMQSFSLQKLPAIVVTIPSKKNDGAIAFSPYLYDRTRFGGVKFLNVIRFLMSVNNQLQQDGILKEIFSNIEEPQPSEKESKANRPQPLFEITPDVPDFCNENQLGLCLISFLDGSPSNEQLQHQLETLKNVQHSPAIRDRVVKFMWIDGICHPSFAEALTVGIDHLPTVVAISPRRRRFAKLLGAFAENSISEFIIGVLTGHVPILPFSEFPVISGDDNCTQAHLSLAAPPEVEGDDDVDDLIAEVLQEHELKQNADNLDADENAKQGIDEEEAQLEHKRKIAQQEIDRLNRMFNVGTLEENR